MRKEEVHIVLCDMLDTVVVDSVWTSELKAREYIQLMNNLSEGYKYTLYSSININNKLIMFRETKKIIREQE